MNTVAQAVQIYEQKLRKNRSVYGSHRKHTGPCRMTDVCRSTRSMFYHDVVVSVVFYVELCLSSRAKTADAKKMIGKADVSSGRGTGGDV